jgi:hypothetical protein
MSTIGQIERKTQRRVIQLFRDKLGYQYLGDWTDRLALRPQPCRLPPAALWREGAARGGREHGHRVAGEVGRSAGQRLRGGRGSDRPRRRPGQWRQGQHQAARRGAVRQRHRAGRAGAEALHGVGVRRHPPEPGQPEEGVHPALLLDDAVGDGGQRHRRPALRHHRDAREVLPLVGRGDRRVRREPNLLDRTCCSCAARRGSWS